MLSQPLSRSCLSGSAMSDVSSTFVPTNPSGHHPAFLIYPIIYVFCTAPLALGRVVTMTGRDISITYFCLAGAMIASNGWLDVLLFSTTRRSIIFNAPLDSENTGLETFEFMRTPYWRQYGNMVWVQGGAQASNGKHSHQLNGQRSVLGFGKIRQLIGWGRGDHRPKKSTGRWIGSPGGGSQESLRGIPRTAEAGIQMDMVTTVVVEIKDNAKTRSREPSGKSIDSSEKIYCHSADCSGSLRP
ncbi:hypothetical protein F4804DRAFT_351149 [Jackrogersella minutella]|nr:hypothetical protein F4804DRAFT_351149 [Jackrogersella minutella]